MANVVDMQAWRRARGDIARPRIDQRLNLAELAPSEKRIAAWASSNFQETEKAFKHNDGRFEQIQNFVDGLADQLNKEFQRSAAAISISCGSITTSSIASL